MYSILHHKSRNSNKFIDFCIIRHRRPCKALRGPGGVSGVFPCLRMRKRHSGAFRWVPVGYGSVLCVSLCTGPGTRRPEVTFTSFRCSQRAEKKTALRFLFLRLPQKGGEPVRLFPKECDLLIVQSIINPHSLKGLDLALGVLVLSCFGLVL